jgi:diguanylate cyclase (GGDEF)-like protein
MQQRLVLINILLPLSLLGMPLFLVDMTFVLPKYLVLVLLLVVLGRAYLLLQQQTLFSVLPLLLLTLSFDAPFQLDIKAPFASSCLLLFLWIVNLQWGQRSWWHPLHLLNGAILLLFVGLALRLIPIPVLINTYSDLPLKWLALFCVISPLLLSLKWTRVGRWAGYWPLFMLLLMQFEWAQQDYLALWVACACLLSLTLDSYVLAFVDELTGIMGRRALMFKLKTAGKHYNLVMVDVDHFKQFNDTYGHQMGDDVLKVVARILSQTGKAKAYRYGGEEFVLLFKNAQASEIKPFIEATREAIANYKLHIKSKKRKKNNRGQRPRVPKAIHVTASFGLARHLSGETLEEVIERADKALYTAKSSGRNCLVMAK